MKMKIAALILLLLAFSFIFSEAETTIDQMKPRVSESFAVNYIQNLGNCSYLVIIKTSCDSSNYTRDQISIAFGDAYGNQVYAPRLDDPFTNTFKSCASDAFQIEGPCTNDICYVYLHRTGSDGWEPETVKIYAPDSIPITYYFNSSIPNEAWYGLNLCHGSSSPFTPPPPFPFIPPPPSFHHPPPPPPPPSFPFIPPPPSFHHPPPPPPSFPFIPPPPSFHHPPPPPPPSPPLPSHPPPPPPSPPPPPPSHPPPPPPSPPPPSHPPPPPPSPPPCPPSSPPPPSPPPPRPPSSPPPPSPSSSHQYCIPRLFVYVILGFIGSVLF